MHRQAWAPGLLGARLAVFVHTVGVASKGDLGSFIMGMGGASGRLAGAAEVPGGAPVRLGVRAEEAVSLGTA